MSFIEENKKAIIEALNKLGSKTVTVWYSGSSDSGCIDDVAFDTDVGDLKVIISINKSEFDSKKNIWKEFVCNDPIPIKEAIKRICYDLLEQHHGGWENDDGADGEFVFDVESGEINWNHNERYTEYNTYSHNV